MISPVSECSEHSEERIEDTGRGVLMSKGYMYILKCSDGTFYTGSTKDLERRLHEHIGESVGSPEDERGAQYTRSRRPVTLVYYEEYDRIDHAFYREKQVHNWNRKKKLALIDGKLEFLPALAKKVFRSPASSIHADKSAHSETWL
jgi:putative endonuclease